MDFADLQNRFSYHPPQDDEQSQKFEMIRSIALSVSVAVNDMVPDSREKSLAITKIEEFVFWANAGIARNE